MQLRAPGPSPIKLDPIRPSAGVRAWYEKQLLQLVNVMCAELRKHACALYASASQPVTPMTFPNGELKTLLDDLEDVWTKIFEDEAEGLAIRFLARVLDHHDRAFKAALAKVGIQVRPPKPAPEGAVVMDSAESSKDKWSSFKIMFDLTPEVQSVIKKNMRANVDLISNRKIKGGEAIPKKCFGEIRTMARKSVESGRDVVGFTHDLEDRFDITRRRASLIARDQNNKITAQIHQARQLNHGIREAAWIETFASLHPREDHSEFSGNTYDVSVGVDFDDGMGPVVPGEAINCGCVSQSIIPGYED